MPDRSAEPAPPPTAAAVAMRERILDVALDHFTRHGYAGTSLREIAEELGFSKAALYYHFRSKQDILIGLHLRLHGLTAELEPLLGQDGEPATWDRIIGQLIGVAIRNRRLIALHLREQEAMGVLHRPDLIERHGDVGMGADEQMLSLLADRSAPIETRVRRLASLGTVVGALLGAQALADVPDEELERVLREVASEVLRPPV